MFVISYGVGTSEAKEAENHYRNHQKPFLSEDDEGMG